MLFDSIGDTLSDIKQGVEDFIEDPWGETKEAASNAWEGIKSGAQAAWDWAKEHKEAIAATLTAAAGVALLFVPGGQGFGAGILIGMAAGGGVSYYQGNDLKTILADASIGGVAGAFGGGVTGGVARGAVRYVGRRAAQLIGNSAGASAGSLADDFLHERKFNWKNATIAAFMGVGFTVLPHMAAQKPVFGITSKAQQAADDVYKISPKSFQKATEGYNRISSSRVDFRGLEVRAQRPLDHLSEKQLKFLFKKGYSPKSKNGDTIILHHHEQKVEGPIIEMPRRYHDLGNPKQHPYGNKGGVGKGEDRQNFDSWRKEYWKARYAEEMKRRGSIHEKRLN